MACHCLPIDPMLFLRIAKSEVNSIASWRVHQHAVGRQCRGMFLAPSLSKAMTMSGFSPGDRM